MTKTYTQYTHTHTEAHTHAYAHNRHIHTLVESDLFCKSCSARPAYRVTVDDRPHPRFHVEDWAICVPCYEFYVSIEAL